VGNPKLPGILNLISESKISLFNFSVDLKVYSTYCKLTDAAIYDIIKMKKKYDLKTIFDFLINPLLRDHFRKRELNEMVDYGPQML
jgi:hypothetical protein